MISDLERIVQRFIQDYQDLNPSNATELNHSPSSLEFSELVRTNRPLVVRGPNTRASQNWTNQYLIEKLGEKKLEISISPDGYADSIVEGKFVEPAKLSLTMKELLQELTNVDPLRSSPVHYLQSQNSNLEGDLKLLREDAGSIPCFARDVFGEDPEAVNIWIGDSRAITSMHKDPYENIYMVVRGRKEFTLLPPSEFYCTHEMLFPHAQYVYDSNTKTFKIVETDPTLLIPWIPVDPAQPDLEKYPRFAHARPMTVILKPGDILYLPTGWFHRVSQSTMEKSEGGEVELAIAVNWWTNMSYTGAAYASSQFLRRCTKLLDGEMEEEEVE